MTEQNISVCSEIPLKMTERACRFLQALLIWRVMDNTSVLAVDLIY